MTSQCEVKACGLFEFHLISLLLAINHGMSMELLFINPYPCFIFCFGAQLFITLLHTVCPSSFSRVEGLLPILHTKYVGVLLVTSMFASIFRMDPPFFSGSSTPLPLSPLPCFSSFTGPVLAILSAVGMGCLYVCVGGMFALRCLLLSRSLSRFIRLSCSFLVLLQVICLSLLNSAQHCCLASGLLTLTSVGYGSTSSTPLLLVSHLRLPCLSALRKLNRRSSLFTYPHRHKGGGLLVRRPMRFQEDVPPPTLRSDYNKHKPNLWRTKRLSVRRVQENVGMCMSHTHQWRSHRKDSHATSSSTEWGK